jgi:chitin disaccharide deacetylase
MMGGAAVDDAVARARRLPSLRVGLHLVLVDGRPLLRPEAIPDLVDADGYLHRNLAAAGTSIFLRPAARRQLAAEIEAQFAAFRATGLPLDHVNAHHHFHVHPAVARPLCAIGPRYGMRAVRVPVERPALLNRIDSSTHHRRDWLAGPWARLLGLRLRRRGFTTPAQVFGLAWSGTMTEARISGMLRHLPDGLTEMYVHPATTNDFSEAARAGGHPVELRALIAPAVTELVRAIGVRTGGYSDFLIW